MKLLNDRPVADEVGSILNDFPLGRVDRSRREDDFDDIAQAIIGRNRDAA
jgi:hypothetical protein